jgi:SH3-like domain-containing protein
MRAGPGLRFPVRWVYTQKGLPIEVTQEFDTWRKIRDADGDEGWVHQSLLSGKRTAIIQGEQKSVPLYRKPDVEARKVAMLEKGVIVPLESCQINWCEVEIQGFDGWIEKKLLWGVYAGTEFD